MSIFVGRLSSTKRLFNFGQTLASQRFASFSKMTTDVGSCSPAAKRENSGFSTASSSLTTDQLPLIIVAGCTGTGKSDLGVALAEKFNGEVISADSMQIYKGLDIVTNKITDDEAKGIPHHLMSFLEPNQEYNVHCFQRDTLKLIDEIRGRQKLPIIVGGTAYYIESVMYKDALIQLESEEETEKVRESLKSRSASDLYKQLQELDPEGAKLVHPNNQFRVLRALEVCLLSGGKKSELAGAQKELRFPRTLLFVLDADTEVLDERLDKRVVKMQEKGVLKELDEYYVKHKQYLGTHGVKQSIGIKEFCRYLELDNEQREAIEGQIILKSCYDELKLHTRQYSRSQRKWFRSRFVKRGKLREIPQYLTLNTSRDFFSTVVPYACDRTDEFLQSGAFVPTESPCLIKNDQHKVHEDENYIQKANTLYRCDICALDIHSEQGYKEHLRGRKHMKKAQWSQNLKDRSAKLANSTNDDAAKLAESPNNNVASSSPT